MPLISKKFIKQGKLSPVILYRWGESTTAFADKTQRTKEMFALFSRNAGMSGLIYLSHNMLDAPGCIHRNR